MNNRLNQMGAKKDHLTTTVKAIMPRILMKNLLIQTSQNHQETKMEYQRVRLNSSQNKVKRNQMCQLSQKT